MLLFYVIRSVYDVSIRNDYFCVKFSAVFRGFGEIQKSKIVNQDGRHSEIMTRFPRHVTSLSHDEELYPPNRPFPSCVLPLFQTESKCEIFNMKMSMICIRMDL